MLVIDRPLLLFPSPRQLISSVWSPQSIEFSLQQSCLPFLRLSCLLQHHLYGDSLAGCLVRRLASPRLTATLTSGFFGVGFSKENIFFITGYEENFDLMQVKYLAKAISLLDAHQY